MHVRTVCTYVLTYVCRYSTHLVQPILYSKTFMRMCCLQSTCDSCSCLLCVDMSAIPGAPSPIPSDGNAVLDAITIQWTSVPFTASPLLYNVAYTLTRTSGLVESGSESVRQWTTCAGMFSMHVRTYILSLAIIFLLQTAMMSIVLDNQTPYTNVKVTVYAVSYWGTSADVTYSFRSTSAGKLVLPVVLNYVHTCVRMCIAYHSDIQYIGI